ncbi:hypothetical protein GCM10023322_08040 [Rugosimonospora acidiphila]|uniref:Uncharacterized protein n=1 Tax=Rugosimonospora acidiphila TaxID=556531 RepID=A0ABP9RJT0_9ACTN
MPVDEGGPGLWVREDVSGDVGHFGVEQPGVAHDHGEAAGVGDAVLVQADDIAARADRLGQGA